MPDSSTQDEVVKQVNTIIENLKNDATYNPSKEREEIDRRIFDLYKISNERCRKIKEFYENL